MWSYSIYHVLPQLLQTLCGQRGGPWVSNRSDSARKLYRKQDSQLHIVGQWESRMQRQGGKKMVRQRDTLPYSCAWFADDLLSMSSLFSLSGLPSIQPLHRHSGWVYQQSCIVCVCVCACRMVSTFCGSVINWRSSSQWACTWTVPCQNHLPGESKGDSVGTNPWRLC